MIVDYVYLTTIYTCFVLFSEFFWYSPRRQVSRSICKCRRFDWHSCSFHQRHGYEKVVTTVCSMELINLWNEPIKMFLPTPTLFPKITSTSRLDSGLSRGNRLTTRIALSFIKLASREHPQQTIAIYSHEAPRCNDYQAWQCSDLGDWQGPFTRLNQLFFNSRRVWFCKDHPNNGGFPHLAAAMRHLELGHTISWGYECDEAFETVVHSFQGVLPDHCGPELCQYQDSRQSGSDVWKVSLDYDWCWKIEALCKPIEPVNR